MVLSDRKPTCIFQQCLLVMWEPLLDRQHTTQCKGVKVTKSFEHIFVRSRSNARRSLYFSDCDSLRRLEESESITQVKQVHTKGSGLRAHSLQTSRKMETVQLGNYSPTFETQTAKVKNRSNIHFCPYYISHVKFLTDITLSNPHLMSVSKPSLWSL